MFVWQQKREDMRSGEYEDVLKRIITCEQRVNGLEIENKMLRDKVLRKIQKLPDAEIADNPINKPFTPFMGM